MPDNASEQPSFYRRDPQGPSLPVLITVPHAGRDYPDSLIADARIDRAGLEMLEDRHADALIDDALQLGATAIVVTRARAWIDLNRDEREVDSGMLSGPFPRDRLLSTPKLRGGLGLIPRRLPASGDILKGAIAYAAVAERIDRDHRPYHTLVATILAEMRRRYGAAILIDCHSMPPLRRVTDPPQVVIGDRFGRSASGRFTERAVAEAQAQGLRTTRNDPYSGGFTLDRHGAPRRGVQAIQVEVDRELYLTPDGRHPGGGIARIRRLIAAIASGLADELSVGWPLAAE
ncbi:N-formylglutamate amidohydrolase [Sphingomonas sp. ID0503]|uniref:N-formylglutamate amidohydrolase n=1 Tax=Sphingomonas sp. ID0503 TaxID=3399691 RepID=UPI003AFA8DF3